MTATSINNEVTIDIRYNITALQAEGKVYAGGKVM